MIPSVVSNTQTDAWHPKRSDWVHCVELCSWLRKSFVRACVANVSMRFSFFWLSPQFPHRQNTENPILQGFFDPKLHGNTCYACYFVLTIPLSTQLYNEFHAGGNPSMDWHLGGSTNTSSHLMLEKLRFIHKQSQYLLIIILCIEKCHQESSSFT